MKIPTDARGAALGPSIVSMAEGTEAIRWNPAALGAMENKEFSTTYIQYFQGVTIENESFAYPLDDSALAVHAFYLGPGSLDGRDTFGNPTGDFQFYDLVGGLSYGRRLRTRAEGVEILAGATIKVVQEQIAETQNQNPALDAGVLISPLDDLNLGASLRNLSMGNANFTKDFMTGASYTVYHVFTGGVAVRYATDAPLRGSVGGEYRFQELNAALRAGYQTHDPVDDSIDSDIPSLRGGGLSGLTMGAGFELRPLFLKTLRFQFDYCMAPFGALGLSHYITVKAKW